MIDPDGARALAVALIEGALRDLERGANPVETVAWFQGGPARLPFTVAADLAGLDPDAIVSALRSRGLLPDAGEAAA